MPHQAIVTTEPGVVSSQSVDTPALKPTQVLIKVQYASFSAFDNHQVIDGLAAQYPQGLGLAAAGEIEKVGDEVGSSLAVGDKVLAHTWPGSDRAIQEYILAEAYAVAKIPSSITPEQAVAVPDNFITAWWTISNPLGLPLPESIQAGSNVVNNPVTEEPVLVWGAGTSAAQFMLQVLKLAGYKHIIATASKSSSANALQLGATQVVDYNDPDVVAKIKQAANGKPIKKAIDTAGFIDGLRKIVDIVAEGATVTFLIPIKITTGSSLREGGHTYAMEVPKDDEAFKKPVNIVPVFTFTYATNAQLRDNLMSKILPATIGAGLVKAPSIRVLSSGNLVERVQEALALFKSGGLGRDRAIVKVAQ